VTAQHQVHPAALLSNHLVKIIKKISSGSYKPNTPFKIAPVANLVVNITIRQIKRKLD
jgi:hypothetical protein